MPIVTEVQALAEIKTRLPVVPAGAEVLAGDNLDQINAAQFSFVCSASEIDLIKACRASIAMFTLSTEMKR